MRGFAHLRLQGGPGGSGTELLAHGRPGGDGSGVSESGHGDLISCEEERTVIKGPAPPAAHMYQRATRGGRPRSTVTRTLLARTCPAPVRTGHCRRRGKARSARNRSRDGTGGEIAPLTPVASPRDPDPQQRYPPPTCRVGPTCPGGTVPTSRLPAPLRPSPGIQGALPANRRGFPGKTRAGPRPPIGGRRSPRVGGGARGDRAGALGGPAGRPGAKSPGSSRWREAGQSRGAARPPVGRGIGAQSLGRAGSSWTRHAGGATARVQALAVAASRGRPVRDTDLFKHTL